MDWLLWSQELRYGERVARGIAEGEAMLEERRRVRSSKRIIVRRNTMGVVALFKQNGISGANGHSKSGAER